MKQALLFLFFFQPLICLALETPNQKRSLDSNLESPYPRGNIRDTE